MPFTVPATLHYDGARDKDTVTFQMDGHTPACPKVVIFDRKVPSATAPKESFRVRAISGSVDSAGAPRAINTTVELVISSHMLTPDSEVQACLSQVLAIAAAEGFAEMAISQQRLPR